MIVLIIQAADDDAGFLEMVDYLAADSHFVGVTEYLANATVAALGLRH